MGDPPAERKGAWAAWLCGALCAVGLALGFDWLNTGKRYSSDPRLNRAAHALVREGARQRMRARAGAVGLPLDPHFSREEAIRFAVGLAGLRPLSGGQADAAGARLASYLKVGRTPSRIVLCGLGLTGEDSGEDGGAVRCETLRRALALAFDSARGAEQAADALAMHAGLAPVQAEAVLAMRAALMLLGAGPAGGEALDALSRDHPRLAGPLLEASAALSRP